MEGSVTQRVVQLLEEKKMSVLAFCEATGLPRSTFNRQINTDSICLQFVQKLLEYYPDISTDWLVMGRGNMYKSKNYDQPKMSFGQFLLSTLTKCSKSEAMKVKNVVDSVVELKENEE